MKRIAQSQRRMRLQQRHLAPKGGSSPEGVAGSLVGLHSSDPATVYLSLAARIPGFTPAMAEKSLYERRTLMRMVGMRRTLFVVPLELAGIMDAACASSLRGAEQRRLIRIIQEQDIAIDGRAWLDDVERQTLAALAARGEATAAELKLDVPELSERIHFGEGKTWGGSVGMSTRVLFLLATGAKIVRGRPLGSWLSSQYRWARVDDWLPEPLAGWDQAAARIELVRSWLSVFGPGTFADVKWWTGWTVRDTTSGLVGAGAVEVELDAGTGFVLPDDLEEVENDAPSVALLPGLDPTTMGWKDRAWYLGDHTRELFDRNGNAGPTVWWDGHVVGAWGQVGSGEVLVQLLEDIGEEASAAVAEKAAELTRWLDGIQVKPRFSTPLQKRIAAS